MNFFKKKNKKPSSSKTVLNNGRRNFISKLSSPISNAAGLSGKNPFGVTSETGYIYVKQNGEVINNYTPSGGPQPYLGSIIMVGFNFAPTSWMQCNGQLLPIVQYDALFTLLGTTYGGDGITTFALPDLRGRIPIHQGQGPGLSSYVLGEIAGVETVTLTTQQLPAHSHALNINSGLGTLSDPSGNYIAQNADGIPACRTTFDGILGVSTIGVTGSSQAHENLQPYLTVTFAIAVEGIFPNNSGGD